MRWFAIKSYGHVWAFTAVISLVSIALSLTITFLAGVPGTPRNYTVATLAPSLIAPPASFFMGWNMLRYHKLNERLRFLLDHDAMTGLLVRGAFFDRAKAVRDRTCAVLLIDIDHFKGINDRYGHAVGDKVIAAVGEVLRTKLENDAISARFGGEEFAVLLPDISEANAIATGEQIIQNLSQHAVNTPEFGSVSFTASAGLCIITPDDDIDTALISADTALYQAKESGRNRLCLWSGASKEPHIERGNIASKSREAWEALIVPCTQPKRRGA